MILQEQAQGAFPVFFGFSSHALDRWTANHNDSSHQLALLPIHCAQSAKKTPDKGRLLPTDLAQKLETQKLTGSLNIDQWPTILWRLLHCKLSAYHNHHTLNYKPKHLHHVSIDPSFLLYQVKVKIYLVKKHLSRLGKLAILTVGKKKLFAQKMEIKSIQCLIISWHHDFQWPVCLRIFRESD